MATTITAQRAEAVVPANKTGDLDKGPNYYIILVIRYIVLILVTIFLIGPFVMALLGSFKSTQEVLAWPPTFLPEVWRTANYADVWNALADANGNSYFPRWILNSLILGTTVTVAHLFFCSVAGFAFARLNFPAKGFIFAAMLSTLMIPGMVLIIPQYQILNALHLVNTYGAIILPNLTAAGMIFLLTQFFRAVPKELDEAAYIDGASIFTTFWRVVLPLAKPALITMALLSFQGMWNNFLSPLVLLNTPEMYPLTVGLSFLKGQYGTFYNVVLAGSMFNTLPMVLLFVFFSRFYVQGVSYSGIK
ncbi:MAG TPA: carbohydrate ABC transporter permease [Chloroflexia bacterium]|jgi:ABC-type glycerol-3-phosphate transport system permease component